MGCAQSRIDNEESVARCKERKNLMREAVVARNAFAAAHCGYTMALKNTGAALSDYGQGESQVTDELHPPLPLDTASQPLPPPPPPMDDNLPPPPPPLPNFSPSPLKRASTMPAITMQHQKGTRGIDSDAIAEEGEDADDDNLEKGNAGKSFNNGTAAVGMQAAPSSSTPRTPDMKPVPPMPESKGMAWDYFFMVDNMPGQSLGGEDEIVGENDVNGAVGFGEAKNLDATGNTGSETMNEVEPKTREKMAENVQDEKIAEAVRGAKHIEHSKTAPTEFRRAMNVDLSVNLMQILHPLDDHFLRASESAREVSKMLEATRLHYHSNFADNRGNIFSWILHCLKLKAFKIIYNTWFSISNTLFCGA